MALDIHEELESQNALLENFELDVAETSTRLSAANQRVRRVLADSRLCGRCSWPCAAAVALLVIVVILTIRVAKMAAFFGGLG